MEFKVVTDHASLKWLMTMKEPRNRLARWSIKLQGFNFKIEHRKGSENVVPDALSRTFSSEEIAELDLSGLHLDLTDPAFSSDEYRQLLKVHEENPHPDIQIVDKLVYKRVNFASGDPVQEADSYRLWLPTALRNKIIKNFHDSPAAGHGGIAKTLHRIRCLFYWPKMVENVKTYVNNCEICKMTKAPNKPLRAPMTQRIVSERPFQTLYLDLIGPYPRSSSGNIGAIVVLDNASKFV
jgi:hypothetical protein